MKISQYYIRFQDSFLLYSSRIGIIFLFIGTSCVPAETINKDKSETDCNEGISDNNTFFDRYINLLMKIGHMPSLSVAIIKDDELVFAKGYGYYDIENDQDRGYGLRGSLIIQKKTEKVNFVIAPFVRWWEIKESEITTDPGGTSWYEPKNNSVEGGGRLAIKF